jgi:translation initiation factor IF-1
VVVAHAPGGQGRNFVRILVGDAVHVELSPVDMGRGRITRRIARA